MIKNLPTNAGNREIWVRCLGQEAPLEEGMETHPSIRAWRIPWTEELGGLPSIGLQIIKHTCSDLVRMHVHWALEQVLKPTGAHISFESAR